MSPKAHQSEGDDTPPTLEKIFAQALCDLGAPAGTVVIVSETRPLYR